MTKFALHRSLIKDTAITIKYYLPKDMKVGGANDSQLWAIK